MNVGCVLEKCTVSVFNSLDNWNVPETIRMLSLDNMSLSMTW